MIIFDENGDVVKTPDKEKGYIDYREKRVVHSYVVDVEEQGHYEVVAEYPETGGKDMEWVIDVPEKGHWETKDANTREIIKDYKCVIPDDLPRENDIEDIFEYGVYIEYTPEELERIKRDNSESEIATARMFQANTAMSLFVQSQAASFTNEQVASVHLLFDDIVWGRKYVKGEVVRHDGKTYRIAQDLTAQEIYKPGAGTESLYTLIDVALDGIRIWHSPTHAENAWNIGEKCHYPDENSAVYISKINGNTTVPGSDGRYWDKEQ